MHHFTFNEKYHEDEPPIDKSYATMSEYFPDNVTSSVDNVSYKKKTNFRSSITVTDEAEQDQTGDKRRSTRDIKR